MVIGIFTDVYPHFLDGVGRVCHSYCETLKQMGHQVYYISANNRYDGELSYETVLSGSIGFPNEAYRVGMPVFDPGFRKKLDAIPFDIVHAHDPFTVSWEALRIAKKRNIPLVTTFHSKYYDDALSKTHSKALAKAFTNQIIRFYHKCDSVWTVNHSTEQVLKSYGYQGPVVVMENGTNPEELSPAAVEEIHRRVPFRNGVPVLLYAGQHNYKKNLHGILEACSLLKKEGQPFHLVTVGDGPDFRAIVDEAKKLGLEKETTFLGFIGDRSLMMALYHEVDLLVFPSLYDTAGLVVQEAATMGTPGLVVAGSCAADGITDGVNGFLSPEKSGRSIEATIKRALPQLEKVGKNAQETLPTPWPEIMVRAVREYEQLIREKKDVEQQLIPEKKMKSSS